jgi:hypothetical protein
VNVLIVVNSDFENVKSELKKAKQLCADEIKSLKKTHKKEKIMPQNIQARLTKLAYLSSLYSVSKILPVRIDGVVINYKLYAAFIKKLKDFNISIAVLSDGVVVQYWKTGTLNQGKGVLKLYDLGPYFKDFRHIPDAALEEHN